MDPTGLPVFLPATLGIEWRFPTELSKGRSQKDLHQVHPQRLIKTSGKIGEEHQDYSEDRDGEFCHHWEGRAKEVATELD